MPVQTFLSLRASGTAGAYLRASVLRRLLVFLVIVLPLVWSFIGYQARQLDGAAREESQRNVQNLAHAFAEEVRSSVVTIDLSLSQLRLSWLRHPEQFGVIAAELDSHLHGRLAMNLAVTDARGRLLFSNVPAARRQVDLGDRDYIRAHLTPQPDGRTVDRLFIGEPVQGRLSGRWTVQFSRPILDRDGKLAGVILAGVAPGYFSRFYDNIKLGPNASIALVRSGGVVIARSTQDQSVRDSGKVLSGFPYTPGSGAYGTFQRISRLDGVDRYYGWRALEDYGLVVTVGQSVLDARLRYARQQAGMLYTGLALSLVLALTGWAALAAADNRERGVAALAAAEARWKLALNAAGEGVWDYSFSTGLITLSPGAQGIVDADGALMPFTRAAFAAVAHPDDVAAVLRALDAHLDGSTPDYVAQYRTRLGNGNWRWVMVRGQVAERAETGEPLRIVGTVADIDARKLQEDAIRHLAHHDMLTGLPNRVLLGDRLQQALLVARRERYKLGVIFFDLDKFKPVNDTYGHAVGDVLLQQVSARLRGTLRASDTLARLGGDEFVVLLPQVSDGDDARKVAEDILRELNRPFVTEGFTLHISASLGVAVFPECAEEADLLLRCADMAMYQAKLGGRGRVAVYDPAQPGSPIPDTQARAAA